MTRKAMLTAVSTLVLFQTAALAQTKVTLLFWPGPESDAMQKVITSYNDGQGKKDGVSVEQILFSRQGYFDKEQTDLAAGSKDFDLALVTTYSLGRYAPYLEPLGSYTNKAGLQAFLPSAVQSLSFKGNLYGVPTDVSNHFTYYRKDLTTRLLTDAAWKTKYGEITQKLLGKKMQPKAPADWTWDDYVAVSLFFTKSINPDSPTQYGTVLQAKNLIFNVMLWQAALVSNGGNLYDKNGKPSINSPAGIKAVNYYATIFENKATPPGSGNYEYAETNEALRSGQAATALQWSAAFHELSDPKLSPLIADKIALAPMPAGTLGHRTHVHSLGIGMNKNSVNKAAAGKFLAYLGSVPAMTVYANAGGLPPVGSVLTTMAKTRPEFPMVATSVDKYGFVVAGGTAAYAVPVYEVLARELSAAWIGSKSPAAALSAAEADMAKLAK